MNRLILLFLLFIPLANGTDLSSTLSGLEGWTIGAITKVNGQFDGCEYGRPIHFTNGYTLICSSYRYKYSYMPSAILLTQEGIYQGKSFYSVKALIDDDIYDMQPVFK